MQNVTLRAMVRTRLLLGTWMTATGRRLGSRRDRGQGAVEYVGVIVLVALIIAALVGSGVANDIANGLTKKVSEILGGGGGK
jgi:hypothetical protein